MTLQELDLFPHLEKFTMVNVQGPYEGTADFPFHLSVGVALINSAGQVATHLLPQFEQYPPRYILMRETVEADESLKDAATRGLAEEFGLTGRFVGYLGSRETTFTDQRPYRAGVMITKTTVYLLYELVGSTATGRDQHDPEGDSQITWKTPREYIAAMDAQGARTDDNNEADIMDRLITRLTSRP